MKSEKQRLYHSSKDHDNSVLGDNTVARHGENNANDKQDNNPDNKLGRSTAPNDACSNPDGSDAVHEKRILLKKTEALFPMR